MSDVNYCEACQSGDHLDLRPFFTFFGGKWRLALNYQPPKHDLIIEPFAGSAGYSVTYHQHKVILIEKDPVIASVWRYLISATREDILNLPELLPGQTIHDLDVCEGARNLIGFWCVSGGAHPQSIISSKTRLAASSGKHGAIRWSQPQVKERLIRQVDHIKHWEIVEGDFSSIENFDATWFIDPPYSKTGHFYRFDLKGSRESLADFCVSRLGQIIVCEDETADWLPFDILLEGSQANCSNGGRTSVECVFNINSGLL